MREYLAVFLVAVVVTYLLAVLARETALRFGAVARVRDRDVHEVPIPYFGGLAMSAASSRRTSWPATCRSCRGPGSRRSPTPASCWWPARMVCALGVVDDLFEIDALTKLGGQVLAAGFMVYNDVQLYYLYLPGNGMLTLDISQAAVATVIIVVATVNAVNFVDGLDGLAAGVVGLGAVGFFLFSYRLAAVNGESLAIPAALLCAALAGRLPGLPVAQLPPGGDVHGRQRVDAHRAGAGRLGADPDGQLPHRRGGGDARQASLLPVLLPVLLPISILVLPFLDLLLAIFRRTPQGPLALQPRQGAPAPPAARARALPPSRGGRSCGSGRR